MFGQIVQVILAIPQILGAIKALLSFWKELTYHKEIKENEKIEQGVLNASTKKEKQDALNAASGSFHK